jgi:hypothetical protein
MNNLNTEKYICVSIKHTKHDLRKNPWWFWCPNYSGYTDNIEKAGIYSRNDFPIDSYPTVKMPISLQRLILLYKNIDSVLILKSELVEFLNKTLSKDYKKLYESQSAIIAKQAEQLETAVETLVRINDIADTSLNKIGLTPTSALHEINVIAFNSVNEIKKKMEK